jgi:hypothetical protein
MPTCSALCIGDSCDSLPGPRSARHRASGFSRRRVLTDVRRRACAHSGKASLAHERGPTGHLIAARVGFIGDVALQASEPPS